MSIFARIDAWQAAVALGVAMLASWCLGWWRGRRLHSRGDVAALGKLDEASIALLGLLLAFTFSMAINKHDRRREMVVSDSNSIGDFYTCVSLLPEPVRTELQNVVREYTRERLELATNPPVGEAFEQAVNRLEKMHGRMTELVGQAVNQGTPIAVSLTNTLNDLTSSHAARLAAFKDRLPTSIVGLLFLAGMIATSLVGRQQGGSPRPHVTVTLSFVILVSLVVYVTLDLNQPQRGLIRVSQEPMERLLSSMSR